MTRGARHDPQRSRYLRKGLIMRRLTQAREAAGLSRTQLGFESKVGPSRIGQMELGRLVPSANSVELRRIANALRFSGDPAELLGEVPDAAYLVQCAQACEDTVNRPITPAMVQASPDMLDALKTARDVLVNALRYLIDDEETEALDADAIIEAAIAKAEGRAS